MAPKTVRPSDSAVTKYVYLAPCFAIEKPSEETYLVTAIELGGSLRERLPYQCVSRNQHHNNARDSELGACWYVYN